MLLGPRAPRQGLVGRPPGKQAKGAEELGRMGGWCDGAGETSWCEGKALITRGGGDELDAVKTEMAILRDDMKVLVIGFEKRIKMLEDNLHSAKEGLDGAKARIVWLESKIEQVTQTNDRRTPAEGTALESTSVVETPPPPVVTGPAPAPVVAPQSESARAACLWHKDIPDSCVEPEYGGEVETSLDEWSTYLVGTLFAKNSDIGYMIYECLKPVWSKCQVTACRTQANRYYHLQCLQCKQCVFAQYDKHTVKASPESKDHAMNLLADFLMVKAPRDKPGT